MFWAFLDIENSYDSVDRDALWQVMRLYRVGRTLLEAIQSFYVGRKACVKNGKEVSEWFSENVVVFEVCVMSQWLFNLNMDGVVRIVEARTQLVGYG